LVHLGAELVHIKVLLAVKKQQRVHLMLELGVHLLFWQAERRFELLQSQHLRRMLLMASSIHLFSWRTCLDLLLLRVGL
jgi:hypothetical protein